MGRLQRVGNIGAITTVSPDLEHPDVDKYGGPYLGGRVPFSYHPSAKTIYLGGPGWYHHDLYDHHDLDLRHDLHTMKEGWFNGGPDWGNGSLVFRQDVPESAEHIHHALSQLHPGIQGIRSFWDIDEEPHHEDDWEIQPD